MPTISVVDITPGAGGTYPEELTALNGKLLFSGNDAAHGTELWVSDGTAAGSSMVKDIFPGSDSSSPGSLIRAGNYVYFSADDGTHGGELWRTDGTEAGTIRLTDVLPGSDWGVNLYSAAVIGSTIYFTGYEASGAQTLWKSNGTAPGTTMVKELSSSGAFLIMEMLAVNGVVYISTYLNGTGNGALWSSDGTEAGTTELQTFSDPGNVTAPEQLSELAGKVYFTITTSGATRLWRSDGTGAGTVAVTPDGFTYIESSAGGSLWLYRDGGLSKSDGTTAGTVLVSSAVSPSGALVEGPGGYLYFSGNSGELWRTDGTNGGTTLVVGGFWGPIGSGDPDELTFFAGTLFFAAGDADHGVEPWTSDGTAAGTVLHDINPKPGDGPHPRNSSFPHDFTELNGSLYFSADDGAGSGGGLYGRELWTTAPSGLSIRTVGPLRGCAGTKIVIRGTEFTGATAVTIDGTPAAFTVVSDRVIRAHVAPGTTTGAVVVTTPAGSTAAGDPYVVPAPKIKSLTPTKGPAGTVATLTGKCFSGATAVTFGGTDAASFTVDSDTKITATIAGGTTTGRIRVTTPGGTGSGMVRFRVTP